MKFRNILFTVLIFFSNITWSQQYSVEYYSQDAELSQDDLVKTGFGRYDGYKFPMTKGELATFIVYSDEFDPLLVLVTPEGKVFYQSKKHQTGLASFTSKIPITGEWVIYILGNESDEGTYLFQYGFANNAAQQIPDERDFCSTLEFLNVHANAHFVFMEQIMSSAGPVKFNGAYDAYLNGDDASYNIVMYDGRDIVEAENIYTSLISEIKKCSEGIKEIKSSKITAAPELKKSTVLQFPNDKRKVVQILFYEYSNSGEDLKSYVVEISILKTKD